MLNIQQNIQEKLKYERGLEMVPLLIHLPPVSDDIQAGGRDARDIVDESISKAQIIYNIISSTVETNIKNRFRGQRHFGFEIVGLNGFVNLYALAPADMIGTIEQALTSAYPSTILERVPEYNIFNEVGGANAIAGGSLKLKQDFVYPIATYQESKRDAMQAILNSLSSLSAEDGVAIQILFRPADDAWRKTATSVAVNRRKGNKSSSGINIADGVRDFAWDFVKAWSKPPEAKDGKDDKSKDISGVDQAVAEAIEDKVKYAGFEVNLRVIASSNILRSAQNAVTGIVSSFAQFDAPGRNGFKYSPTKDMDTFMTNYMLRHFSYSKKKNILSSVELATIFHFPDQRSTPTTQLERQGSKQVDGPRNMPDRGLLLGYNVFRGVKKPVRLDIGDRQRHMYVVGQTGTGKSTFLENLALQDMMAGNGFAFVDPHGDTAEKLLSMVPKERAEDIIYFCPSDMDYPMGMNLFEYHSEDQKDFLIQEVLNMLYKLYDPQHQGIMGPRYESLFRNAALTIMADPNGGTFIDVPKLFRDPQFAKQKLQYVKDPNVREFWEKEMPQSQRSNEFGDVVSWFVSKFGAFLSNEMMRNIIGQTKSAFDLRYIMDNKKILLVNLSKGRTGELNSKLLGMMFVMKFQAAAMSRSDIPEHERVDFSLYVDEFQNFSTDSFATILSEARKFRLNLIVANQFTTQLTEEIRDAVFGNIGTVVAFRVGQNDVEKLSQYFQPQFDGNDLLRIPNYNTVVRTLVSGVPTQSFSMATLEPLGNPNKELGDALKQLSAAKYGRPRAVVEKDIFSRLETKSAAPMANPFAGQSATAGPRPVAPAPRPAPPGGGTFLDQWAAKQRAMPTQSGGVPVPPQPFASPAQVPPTSHFRQGNYSASQTGPRPAFDPIPAPAQPSFGPPSNSGVAGNVSSATLDQQEVQSIAHQLRQNLPKSGPSEATISLNDPHESDEITIDRNGNLSGPAQAT